MKEEEKLTKLPGGKLASRPIHFIWILDVSESMANGGKIQTLNNAIREALPNMKEVAAKNCEADFFVRAITFSNGPSGILRNPSVLRISNGRM